MMATETESLPVGDDDSGKQASLGTPSEDIDMAPPSSEDEDQMVVSGGGVASTEDEDSATGKSDRGLG
jgi:hypothetical protein